jgi:hypothetical protein
MALFEIPHRQTEQAHITGDARCGVHPLTQLVEFDPIHVKWRFCVNNCRYHCALHDRQLFHADSDQRCCYSSADDSRLLGIYSAPRCPYNLIKQGWQDRPEDSDRLEVAPILRSHGLSGRADTNSDDRLSNQRELPSQVCGIEHSRKKDQRETTEPIR